jgi:hypothetical protein
LVLVGLSKILSYFDEIESKMLFLHKGTDFFFTQRPNFWANSGGKFFVKSWQHWLQEMIDEADRDGDGEVNEDDFLRIMKKTGLY